MNKFDIKKVKWVNLLLIIFCSGLIVGLFKTFLIPGAFAMVNILLKLIDLYKLLEMPYLFFGSAFFLCLSWYVFTAVCNVIFRLFQFVITTKVYVSQFRRKEKQ